VKARSRTRSSSSDSRCPRLFPPGGDVHEPGVLLLLEPDRELRRRDPRGREKNEGNFSDAAWVQEVINASSSRTSTGLVELPLPR